MFWFRLNFNFLSSHSFFFVFQCPLIVDHQMRPNSTSEADTVASLLTSHGLYSHILTAQWPEQLPKNLTTARQIRYTTLSTWCKEHDSFLFLGHHKDDQIEQIFYRISRCSGLVGLACMREVEKNELFNLTLIRPLLTFPKSRLISLCNEFKIPFVTDPSNSNLTTWRGKFRSLISAPQSHPTDTIKKSDLECITSILHFAQTLRIAIEKQIDHFITTHVTHYSSYYAIPKDPFYALLRPIAVRVLMKLVAQLASLPLPLESKQFEKAVNEIMNYPTSSHSCLVSGCMVMKGQNENSFVIFKKTNSRLQTNFVYDEEKVNFSAVLEDWNVTLTPSNVKKYLRANNIPPKFVLKYWKKKTYATWRIKQKLLTQPTLLTALSSFPIIVDHDGKLVTILMEGEQKVRRFTAQTTIVKNRG
jgi:tRNA(Ile)-lysidine synthetase-like protein